MLNKLVVLCCLLATAPTLAGIGSTLNSMATVGMDTSVLDFYAKVPFSKHLCANRNQYPNSRSAECEMACGCNGFAPACAATPGWDKISGYAWTTWWMTYMVDLANDLMKQASWATSGFEPPAAHTLPPNGWDHVSRGLSIGYCALSLVNGVMIAHSYATGGDCQSNYLMAVTGMDVLCQVAIAASTCGEVLRYAGPVYSAYVSSGAQAAMTSLYASCAVGAFMAERMKCAVSEKACLAAVDMGRGIDVRTDPDGRTRANQCCRCNRQLFQDRTWPRRDVPLTERQPWGSVVSSANRDIECEGRPNRKYAVADTSGARRSLYNWYTDCHRAAPDSNGQCWISQP